MGDPTRDTGFVPARRSSAREIDRQARIFRSFEYLREILNSCPYLAFVLNGDAQIVFFNDAVSGLIATARERGVLGRRFGEALNCVHSGGDKALCGTSEFCQACGAFQAISEGINNVAGAKECRLTCVREGREEALDLLVSVSPVVVCDEQFLVCSLRDISHEKRREALEHIFFHDILNDATGLELMASALQSMVKGEASRFAEMVRGCASALIEEIETQRLLLRAEKEELAVNPASLSAAELVREMVERYRVHPLGRNRVVHVADDSQDIAIFSDQVILSRVLQNMLKNALEASAPGETVTAGWRDADPRIELWVRNPHVMPKKVQLEIFKRSFSTKGNGRGLGTYSMKLLSERYLQGTVTFRSAKGEGTTFIASYPKNLSPTGTPSL
jgi:signal transduction histidine kinase